MTLGTVAYSEEIKCPSCGHEFSGYYAVLKDGQGKTVCPSCHVDIVQPLPQHYVPQIPPADFESPERPHVHHSNYPGLYDQPKSHPRFQFIDVLRVAVSPRKTFLKLFVGTNMQRSLAIVAVFSMVLVGLSILVSVDMADVIGFDAGDAVQFGGKAFFAWALSILTFMIFSFTASAISKGVFGGRGDRSSTIALVGYCFPLYVLVSAVLFLIFEVGFESVGVLPLSEWSSQVVDKVTAGVFLLVGVALIGVVWLLVIASWAVSVANDISLGEGALTAIMSATAAGLLFLIVQAIMSLPLLFVF